MPPDPPAFDLYAELEVNPNATVPTIEAAYRSLMKRHHPDATGARTSTRVIRLNLAREWLTDPVRRSAYDTERASVGEHSNSRDARRRLAPADRIVGYGFVAVIAIVAGLLGAASDMAAMRVVGIVGLAAALAAAVGLMATALSRGEWSPFDPLLEPLFRKRQR